MILKENYSPFGQISWYHQFEENKPLKLHRLHNLLKFWQKHKNIAQIPQRQIEGFLNTETFGDHHRE